MTDQTLTPPRDAAVQTAETSTSTAVPGAPVPAGTFDATARATEFAILDALRSVVDPEIGMNVVELALIKQIILGPESTEIKMILTTPFCPYAGSMVQQPLSTSSVLATSPCLAVRSRI